ncbi:MAG: DUF1570 domain-containing protein [Planctomycetaceae bacterium]
MWLLRIGLTGIALLAGSATALGTPPALVELLIGDRKYEGKVVAHTDLAFWLIGQDGRLSIFDADSVKTFRQLSPKFQGWNASIVKDQLRREFGRPYDVVSTRHYVVVARGDAQARVYADTLEDFFGTFQMYFSLRGFKVPEPEFPLVAIVFPTQEAFAKYAQQERQRVSRMVRGYYMPTSNRITFFESESEALSHVEPTRAGPGRLTPEPALCDLKPADAADAIEASLKDTLIHEATHQAAYNTGLHSRIGENPVWMVEGLATVFEAPGVRSSRANTGIRSRVNRERLVWFGNFVKERRRPQSLEALIASDDLFSQNPLDAYSQAWALTFFLFETRPRNYAEYLRAVASRNSLERYAAAARVADFERAMGKELKLLEAEFLRFMADLK